MNLKNIAYGVFRALFMGDKYFRYSIFARIINTIYPRMVVTEYGKYFEEDKNFIRYYNSFEGGNYNSFDRKFTLREFLKLTKNLSGDTVECGGFKGATSYLILENIGTEKHHHIFDSWEGLSKPSSEDGNYWGESNLTASEQTIRENLKRFSNVSFYKGWIPEKFSEIKDCTISFIHIDVDLYAPTKDSLELLYPQVQSGGVIICDDYGFITCPGARKAMNEFAEKEKLTILELTTGQGIIIKP